MRQPKRRTAQTVTLTAPIGGLNTATSLATMAPTEAVIMDNWFCLPTELQLRKGYTQWATGLTGTVKSFLTYDSQTGTHQFFAVSGSGSSYKIYNTTSKGAVGAAVVSGLTGGDFKHQLSTTSGGSFLIAVNGVDNALLYDGTTWHSLTQTSSPYKLQGVDSNKLWTVKLHKRRLWFVEKNSLKCWYGDTDAVSGTLHSYDFGPLFARGGKIAAIDTWTLDAGAGMDDYFVVVTTSGEVAVFTGTDPADATNWSLKGIYQVGSPTGTNPTIKYAGDVLMIGKDGLTPLSQSLMSSRVNTRQTISAKIQNRLAELTTTYENNYGWQVILYPPANMLLVNVPTGDTTSDQYVMNTITGAWSRFTGINAVCWIFINEQLYFAKDGKIYLFWDGVSDDGSVIISDLLPAFSAFGSQSQIKRFMMHRISMGADTSFSYNSTLAIDFDQSTTPDTPYGAPASSQALWGVAKWDLAKWSTGIVPFAQWKYLGGMGHYGSVRLKTSSKVANIRFYSLDIVYEFGGVL